MSYSPVFRGSVNDFSVGNSKTIGDEAVNLTGSLRSRLTPVTINSLGDISVIDISSDSSLAVIGVLSEDIDNLSSGSFVNAGIIEDITTSFDFGDVCYVSKAGILTNVKPNAGENGYISGDYLIRIGVIKKNKIDSLKKDLFVNISVVGRL